MFGGQFGVFLKPRIPSKPYFTKCTMLSKKQKLSSKKSRKIEGPSHDYDHEKFLNVSAAEKFGLMSKSQSFIKEKGFHHPDDFFHQTIVNKGRKAIFQPPKAGFHNGGTRILRQFSCPCSEKGPSA